jgi:hypothetical protein
MNNIDALIKFDPICENDFSRGQKMVLTGLIVQYWDAVRLKFDEETINTAYSAVMNCYSLYNGVEKQNPIIEAAIYEMKNRGLYGN